MLELFINISRIWSYANSLEVLLYGVDLPRWDTQVLLEVSENHSNETWYLEKPLHRSRSSHEGRGSEVKVVVENLRPLTKYVLCPSLIDESGKVWSEGECKMVSTGVDVDCTEAVVIASVFFGLVIFFVGVGFVGYRLLHKGLRKGFNLPSLSGSKE